MPRLRKRKVRESQKSEQVEYLSGFQLEKILVNDIATKRVIALGSERNFK